MNNQMNESSEDVDLSKLKDRLLFARKRKNLSQKELVDLVGMSQPTYSALESGKNKRTSYLPELAKALGVPVTFLSGEDLLNNSEIELTETMDRESEIYDNRVRSVIHLKRSSIPRVISRSNDGNKRHEIPLMDIKFSCGDGESIEFHFEAMSQSLTFNDSFFTKRGVNPENCRMLRATGDSMEPVVYDGDCFMIDLTDNVIRDGQIYAVYFEGEAMLKRVFKESGGELKLVSDNKEKYREKSVNQENGAGFKVIGRAIYRSGGL